MAIKRVQLRLVSRKKNGRTGRQHVSSSSDGIVDYAAAVIVGKLPAEGLASIIPDKYHRRAKNLLRKNEVAEVAIKRTPRIDQQRNKIRRDSKDLLPLIMGPIYNVENEHKLSSTKFLNTKTLIAWIRSSLATPNSRLNKALSKAKYHDLVGLERSPRWWLDTLQLKSAE
jgi:hypothetical protein